MTGARNVGLERFRIKQQTKVAVAEAAGRGRLDEAGPPGARPPS